MEILGTLSLVGSFVFAISASLSAIKRKFDFFGISFIAFVTAFGGGTARDIILGIHPITWLNNRYYPVAAVAGLVVSFMFYKRLFRFKRMFFWFDTVGIGIATVIGINKGLDAGVDPWLTVIFGVISAVLGGVIRDIICNDVPIILRREIYATACLAGGVLYVLLLWVGAADFLAAVISIAVIISLRWAAIKYKITLPAPKHDLR